MDALLTRVLPIRAITSPACAAPGPRRMNQTVPCFNRITVQQAPSRPEAFCVNPPSTERERERIERDVTLLMFSGRVCRFTARSSTGQPGFHAQAPQAAQAAPNGQSPPVPQMGSWEGHGSPGRQVARWPGQKSSISGLNSVILSTSTNRSAVCQPHSMHLSMPPKVLAMSQHEIVTQESRDWTMLGRKHKKKQGNMSQ